MTAKEIETLLEQALLHDGQMAQALFEFEFEEADLEELKASLIEDDDDFLFAVTENTGDVAMVLIEKSLQVHSNEQAREKLKDFWESAYEHNLKMMIPDFAQQLSAGELPINGVKIED
jgi:molybdopterin-biosynthesis enzyme MoeA-like protein